jgi:cephalosporin hydroxylase
MAEALDIDTELLEGWVDGCAQGIVRGWARRPGAPRDPVTVEILVDDVVVGRGIARLKRADLEAAGKGDCGFEIAIEFGRLTTPKTEAIVRARNGAALTGSPVAIDVTELVARHPPTGDRPLATLPVPFTGAVGGYLDAFGPGGIAGWIYDPVEPSPPVVFEIWEAGRRLATVTADRWRVDLEEMRQGDGRWGFAAPLPPVLLDDRNHEIDLRLAATGRSVLAEPLLFHLPKSDGVAPIAPARPKRDVEAAASSWTRPLDRPAPPGTLFTIIVNFYNMQREAARTLTSLSRSYQRGIGDLRYEVLCIDNGSDPPLDPDWIASFGPEFRLIRPSRVLPSPCAAINEAAREAAGHYLAIMIDGAYVLTPGVLREAWDAIEERPGSIVALRQWFVGGDQRWLAQIGYGGRQEDMLFDKIAWPDEGYDLFKIGSPVRESPNNWFDGMIETNCLFLPARLYRAIDGMNESFAVAGAGFANLDLFKRAAETVGEPVVALLGEASFHQFHGGTTTNVPDDEMARRVRGYDQDYFQIAGKPFLGVPLIDLHLRGQFRTARGTAGRQRPLSPARLGLTDRVRPGSLPLHFDEAAAAYLQSVYVECGLHRETTWQGHRVSLAPADVLNIQDIIHRARPGRIVVVNAEYGLLLLLESLVRLSQIDGARIVSIGGEAADLPPGIDRIAGDPLAPNVLAATEAALGAEEQILVLYTPRAGDHFPIEALRAYARFVSCRSYLVFIGSVFGQPWLGYSKNWFQKAIRILVSEAPFAIDFSRDQHLINTCPHGYLQRIGGFVALAEDDDLRWTVTVCEEPR